MTWQAEQALKCPGCGNRRDESFDPDREYEPVVLVCHACGARERHANHLREHGGIPGAYIGVREVPESERITSDDLM